MITMRCAWLYACAELGDQAEAEWPANSGRPARLSGGAEALSV